jgi:hypothetical protein
MLATTNRRRLVMDKGMLHYLAALKQQIEAHEAMLFHIFEIEALLEPLLAGNLLDFPMLKLHDYLSIVSGSVIKLKNLNEQLLSLLNKIRRESLPQ